MAAGISLQNRAPMEKSSLLLYSEYVVESLCDSTVTLLNASTERHRA